LLRELEATGTLAFAGDLEFDTRRPGDTRIAWNFANECRITRVPENLSPDRFRRPWARTVLAADGSPVTVESGPGTDTWVPFAEISPFMQTAIVVCEDSRFFQHDGFDAKAIQDSIRNNLRAGSFVRGGSTVSMQLAKNLYLGREKTLSRKLQEAVLTLLLEQALTKEQILELYLNVIEFAPGVYGIGPAASHYFRSLPRDLSLGQALYLGTILPNPKNRHFSPDGTLSDRWSEYLRKLMVIAHKIRRIDDHALARGLAETVRFGMAADPGAAVTDGDNPTDLAPPEDTFQGMEGP
jgi:membrane peptidoglycan carboxypeptidase